MKKIKCHNLYHLGDCIETLHFLIHASRINDVQFDFFCNPQYHNQISPLIERDNVNLISHIDVLENSIDTWIGAYQYDKIFEKSDLIFKDQSDQGTCFLLLWEMVSKKMEIKTPFSNKNEMIYDEEVLNLPCRHKEEYDFLFINSKPFSLVYNNFEEENYLFLDWLKQQNKKVITTRKIENYPCTLDYNLSVVEIGQLSKNIKNIVSVNTGPLHLCMNKWSLENIEKFIIWTPAESFNYGEKFKTVRSLKEIII